MPPSRSGQSLDIVVSSVLSDAHTWNLVFLGLVLEELGHRVANLGPCVPDHLLVSECVERAPSPVVLSSVNGHGFHDGARVVREPRSRPELLGTPIVIGGKSGVTGAEGDAERVAALVDAGLGAVFGEGDPVLGPGGRLPGDLPSGRGVDPFPVLVGRLAAVPSC